MKLQNVQKALLRAESAFVVDRTRGDATSRVLANTYRLLAMTLVFSGLTATASVSFNLPFPGLIVTLVGYFGLLFLTSYLKNSAWGLVSVFALTGFMGFTLGPMLNAYLSMASGQAIIASAFSITGISFIGLSLYAQHAEPKRFLAWENFLMIGIITAFCLGVSAVVLNLPALSLAVSGLFVLLMAGLILYQTQSILSGGETNYIMATVTLYVSIFNLFTSLLHILGFMNSDE